ncbi:LysR family transcriptional regulator [Roseateles sp.]|uniref:LysR family transcriptional regulator n=1 Tax=Roseateles sp. TaxID=1971397 RepID=UPI003BA4064A
MPDLEDLRLFHALGGTGSLAATARILGVTPPALTSRLKRLEADLGVSLAVRSSRGVRLTEEGERLRDEASAVLLRIEGLAEVVAGDKGPLAGSLRVAAPFGFGREHLATIVRDFHRANGGVTINVRLSDNPLRDATTNDVVIHIGGLRDSTWVQHLLAPNRRILCASPDLARRLSGTLTHPSQLAQLPCLRLSENDEDLVRWSFFRTGQGKPVSVRILGPLSSNDGAMITSWALNGLGVMVRSEWQVGPLIARGKLVELLPQWRMHDAPVLALTKTRLGMPRRVRAFLDACRSGLSPAPWKL